MQTMGSCSRCAANSYRGAGGIFAHLRPGVKTAVRPAGRATSAAVRCTTRRTSSTQATRAAARRSSRASTERFSPRSNPEHAADLDELLGPARVSRRCKIVPHYLLAAPRRPGECFHPACRDRGHGAASAFSRRAAGRRQGSRVEFIRLDDLARELLANRAAIPVRDQVLAEIDGRSGVVATYGVSRLRGSKFLVQGLSASNLEPRTPELRTQNLLPPIQAVKATAQAGHNQVRQPEQQVGAVFRMVVEPAGP